MIDSFVPENLSRFSVLELVDPKSCRIFYAGPYEVSADAGKNSSLAWFTPPRTRDRGSSWGNMKSGALRAFYTSCRSCRNLMLRCACHYPRPGPYSCPAVAALSWSQVPDPGLRRRKAWKCVTGKAANARAHWGASTVVVLKSFSRSARSPHG